jgi:hypothetical protein
MKEIYYFENRISPLHQHILIYLYFDYNYISGNIPSSINNMKALLKLSFLD